MTPAQILGEARKKIDTFDKWCQRSTARKTSYRWDLKAFVLTPCSTADRHASQYCAIGAVHSIVPNPYFENPAVEFHDALSALATACHTLEGYDSLVAFNDMIDYNMVSHHRILNVYDEAIMIAEYGIPLRKE